MVVASFLRRCISAAEVCAAACELVLAADPSYTSPNTNQYSEAHLALVSCTSVCTLAARALREGDADLELLRWAGEISSKCACAARPDGVPDEQWAVVVAACRRCASHCRAVIERISGAARDALGEGLDSGLMSIV